MKVQQVLSKYRKKESNQYQKLLEIEKEIVREVVRGDKHNRTWENLKIAKHKSVHMQSE